MLAKLVRKPFDKPGWTYEEKYDGYRILAYKEGDRVRLISRNGIDRTASYPSVASAVAALRPRTLLLDGEVVAFDRARISRFQLLQISKAKAAYAVFDCLYDRGRDLRRAPLTARRAALEAALAGSKGRTLVPSRRLEKNGLEAFAAAKKKGLEGIVAKNLSSPYVAGRSSEWLKVKAHQEEEFVIAGYSAPEGAREHFGALLLGAHENGKLRFVGKVGTGFTRETLATLFRTFRPLVRKNSPFAGPPRERGVTYLKPKLVGQFAFHEWTADKKLRQPVFLGLRNDKSAREVLMPKMEKP
jgi:bifunctional non-homologous end joining protein LigD